MIRLLISRSLFNSPVITSSIIKMTAKDMKAPSSSMPQFREDFAKAKHIVVLTGAGVSAESGVPTFRGAGGYWRKWQAQQLATPEAFEDNPSLVWEFYHYRRKSWVQKIQTRLILQYLNTNFTRELGQENILELHGSLFKTRCTKCEEVIENRLSPICPALADKGEPDPKAKDAKIPVDQLPKCKKAGCGGLLRPHVVWFGESLDPAVMDSAENELDHCDLCLVVGTSSVVYPAAMFAPKVASRGVPVAEFNPEKTDVTNSLGYHFHGPAGSFLPEALARHPSEPD
ncbi:SIR2L5 [Mytilus edulis]|uniref:NAD-dependent protein deacylase n=1 Tax=Mytilus edulis TaxID=6550 RepID=A0A8S3QXQ7_MYTED|nr:SIR2L5 [Mytilus edulis]